MLPLSYTAADVTIGFNGHFIVEFLKTIGTDGEVRLSLKDGSSAAVIMPEANGINRVRIDLTAADLYDMTFIRARGLKVFYETKIEGLHCDQLRSIFTEATGLEVSLGSMRADRFCL